MIQIAFEPAFDPFHTTFRILQQIEFRGIKAVELSRVRILDFFMLEPGRCLDIRLPPGLKKAARSAANCQPPTYGRQPSKQVLFNRMVPMQDAAMQTLVLKGFLDEPSFQDGTVIRTGVALPIELADRISLANSKNQALLEFLVTTLDTLPFFGMGGLKDRTGLGEFRYDIV